ncbi:hypothetical protein HBE96_13310 [Clostridium sp. P21]|uniref:DUF4829 domain-containing protein n=1 Tax=Clostridium muellerianum TaxID=2716538 RepID=A0A7Y0HQC4_9CLOT|nr:hypothetical protein [Clostridium muellerianum]NMM63633.1 hypothetical protein [Clostridium muellerianum]
MLIAFMLALTSCGTNKTSSSNKKIDIYNTVKEAFLTDKGYSDELSKHMSEDVFKRTNIYNAYPVNNPEYKKPFKVDFSLKEDSQSVKKDIIYVKMTYSVSIKDSQNKAVGGSWDIPITFTVKKTETGWYIIDKHEPA